MFVLFKSWSTSTTCVTRFWLSLQSERLAVRPRLAQKIPDPKRLVAPQMCSGNLKREKHSSCLSLLLATIYHQQCSVLAADGLVYPKSAVVFSLSKSSPSVLSKRSQLVPMCAASLSTNGSKVKICDLRSMFYSKSLL